MAAEHKCEIFIRKRGRVYPCPNGAYESFNGHWRCHVHLPHRLSARREKINQANAQESASIFAVNPARLP